MMCGTMYLHIIRWVYPDRKGLPLLQDYYTITKWRMSLAQAGAPGTSRGVCQ
jgi:hypothetical protein